MYTSIRQTPRENEHLEFVRAFLHTLSLTLQETDISQRPTLSSLLKSAPSYIYIYLIHVCIFMKKIICVVCLAVISSLLHASQPNM